MGHFECSMNKWVPAQSTCDAAEDDWNDDITVECAFPRPFAGFCFVCETHTHKTARPPLLRLNAGRVHHEPRRLPLASCLCRCRCWCRWGDDSEIIQKLSAGDLVDAYCSKNSCWQARRRRPPPACPTWLS